MAILGWRNHRRLSLISLPRFPLPVPMAKAQRLEHTAIDGRGDERPTSAPESGGDFNSLMWRTADSRSLGIHHSAVDSSVLCLLRLLKQGGFGAYLVGGCVRDLLLKKPPKDFDVVTTANLKQVSKQFMRTMTVGRRFPICLVKIKGAWIEVSSFKTVSENSPGNQNFSFQIPTGCDTEDAVLWENCMRRDFTINSLFYDPCSNKLYDYVNGLNDLRTSKVRTVVPAHVSFAEDCARILRGIRIAARLGFSFSEETAEAILNLSSCLRSLAKPRLLMEMNYMLAYGAAVPSILLLHRFKLLEILLPAQAAYLTHHKGNRAGQSSLMLMKLFCAADKLLAANRPSDCKLWLALLAFHLALVECPQSADTVWTFCSILYHGEKMKTINVAKANANNVHSYFPEILHTSGVKSDRLLLNDASYFASMVKSSLCSLTCSNKLIKVLKRYQQSSPSIGMVFVSESTAKKVGQVFDIFCDATVSSVTERTTYSIDYDLLKKGDLNETRFVLGKIIMDTLRSRIEIGTGTENQKPANNSFIEKDGNETDAQALSQGMHMHKGDLQATQKLAQVTRSRACHHKEADGVDTVGKQVENQVIADGENRKERAFKNAHAIKVKQPKHSMEFMKGKSQVHKPIHSAKHARSVKVINQTNGGAVQIKQPNSGWEGGARNQVEGQTVLEIGEGKPPLSRLFRRSPKMRTRK